MIDTERTQLVSALAEVTACLSARRAGKPWPEDQEKRALALAAPFVNLPKPKPTEYTTHG